ncbi:MAG: AAA family ATPase [Nanoarchaeota archaeon]|nr:AAA family ATPase [Nanoarchaeota archaeon]
MKDELDRTNNEQEEVPEDNQPGIRPQSGEDFKDVAHHKQLGHAEPIIKGNIKVKHRPSTPAIKRVPTGIPGLDQAIEGGLKKNSVTLAGGCAGAGKSIFAMQFLVKGITEFDEPGVYVSFEESRKEVYEDMLRFGWDLKKLEEEGKFEFIEYTPEQVEKIMKTGGGVIRDVIDKIGAKRLIIDSISAFMLLHETELKRRESALALFAMLRRWDCTTLVIGQYAQEGPSHESSVLEFEVDSIIWLYNIKKEDIRVRALEVFKMRGTKHTAKTFPVQIKEDGIVLYPEETLF